MIVQLNRPIFLIQRVQDGKFYTANHYLRGKQKDQFDDAFAPRTFTERRYAEAALSQHLRTLGLAKNPSARKYYTILEADQLTTHEGH